MRLPKTAFIAVAAMLSAQHLWAQSSTLFPSSGGGTRSGGSSLFGSGAAGGGSAFGGTAGGAGQSSIDTSLGTRGVNTQFSGGFVGRNAEQGFVGSNNQNGTGGSTGRGGTTGRGQIGRGAGGFGNQQFGLGNQFQQQQGGRGRFGGGGGNNTTTVPYRTTVGFRYTRPSIAPVRLAIATRMGRFAERIRLNAPLAVQVSDTGTVIISGVVTSNRDRQMAENLVKLEPGVAGVENRITVMKP